MTKVLVLVVEDDPMVRLLTQQQLVRLGYAYETAATGEEAVQKYRSDFALILMDVGLPGIDGIVATRLIRNIEQKDGLRRMPIIALTAYSNRDECLSAGMDDHLQKPALLDDFRRIFERWLPA